MRSAISATLRGPRRMFSRAAIPLFERGADGFAGEISQKIRKARYSEVADPALDHWRYPDAQAERYNPTEAVKVLSFIWSNADRINRTASLFADEASRSLLADLLAYRALGPKHVSLPKSTPSYLSLFHKARSMRAGDSPFDFPPFEMARYSTPFGTVDCWLGNVVAGLERQYWFSRGAEIAPERGDVVIDAGACFGDTALAFADAVGPAGSVHAFEPVAKQRLILAHNLKANPELAERIRDHPFATGAKSGDTLFFGEGASAHSSARGSNPVHTLALDDLELDRLSYIKMDVEGAETDSLRGAVSTIRRFKPKLGISVYHSLTDLITIPQLVHQIEPSYKLFLDHHTIYAEETILYAATADQL